MVSSILPKTNENNSTWGTIVVKLNFLVRFLGEMKLPKRHFEINWPLTFCWNRSKDFSWVWDKCMRIKPHHKFFARIGHETTHASSGNKYLFTISKITKSFFSVENWSNLSKKTFLWSIGGSPSFIMGPFYYWNVLKLLISRVCTYFIF